MKKLFAVVVIMMLCLGLGAPAFAEPPETITEKQILALFKTIDEEMKQKSVKTVVSLMSKDLLITLVVPTPQGPRTRVVTPEQYEINSRQQWELITKYKRWRKSISIEIAEDGKSATFTDNLSESVVLKDATIDAVIRETYAFELRNGKLVITSMEGEIDRDSVQVR